MTVFKLVKATEEKFVIWSSNGESLFNSMYSTFVDFKQYSDCTVEHFSIGSESGTKVIDIFIED